MLRITPARATILWLTVLLAAGVTVPLLAADPRARALAGNTLLLAIGVAVASVVLGAPLAFLVARTDARGRRAAGVVVLALVFTPLYLQAAAWQAGFGMMGWFTLAVGGAPLVDGWCGTIFIHTLAAIPWVVLIVGLGLRLAEPELEEEALLDATPGVVFRRVTLRRAGEALAAAFLWVAVTTAGDMTVTDLFQIRTYAEEVYTQFALGDTLAGATWNLVPSMLATAWVLVLGLVLVGRLMPSDRHVQWRESRVFRLGRWRAAASAWLLGSMALLVAVPAASLLVKAGRVVTRGDAGFVRSWSAEQCLSMVAGSPLRFPREFGWTLAIAAPAATLALAAGLPLAWSARRGGWRAMPAWFAIAVCLALPGPVVGLGLIGIFNGTGMVPLVWLYDHSIVPIALAQMLRGLPLCTLVLWYALRTIPEDLVASAALEGASPMTRLWRVVVPQHWPAIAVAWLVVVAIAVGELAASILVVPPGVTTLPIQIFGLIHYGVDDQVAGVALFVMILIFVLAAGVQALARAGSRRAALPSDR